jgi:hypothetical protein
VTAGCVYISRDVVFDKTFFLFAHLNPNAGRRLRKEILLLASPTSLTSNNEGDHVDNSMFIVPIATNPPHEHVKYSEDNKLTTKGQVQCQVKILKKI